MCITAFAGVASYAQTYLRSDDAIDALKTAQVEMQDENAVQLNESRISVFTNGDHASEAKYTAAKRRAITGLIKTIQNEGNSEESLQYVLNHNSITKLNLKDEATVNLEEFLVGIITKTE